MKKQMWSYAESKGIKIPKGGKPKGKWFKGDFGMMSSKKMGEMMKVHQKGVKKPTAVRTKMIKGKPHSQFYHKPLSPNELY